MRITKFGWFLIISIALLIFSYVQRDNIALFFQGVIETASATEEPAATQSGAGNTLPTVQVPGSEVLPGEVANDGLYPIACRPGTNLPQLDVAVDGYPGYYPLIYMYAKFPASDKYCINLMPKWSGPNFDRYGYEENQIEQLLASAAVGDQPGYETVAVGTLEADGTGAVDIYFGTNGGLSLFDSRSGRVIYSPSGSTGADQIWALNSVASPFSPTGKPTFNDSFGRSIITSQGGADHFLALRMMQLVGLTINDVDIIFPEDGTGNPVDNFCDGNGDFVAYWQPIISGANCQDATLLLSTNWWKGAVTDYIVVSDSADANLEEAIAYFLNDYNNATQAFTVDNLAATETVLTSTQFQGDNLTSWMFLDVKNLAEQMSGVAIAKFSDNVIIFDKNFSGSSLVEEQFVRAHNTWQYGNVNGNGNGNALFDVNLFVSDKYINYLIDMNTPQVTGDFSNIYDTDVAQRPIEDETVLISLPDWGVLPYKQIGFVPGFSNLLLPGEKEKVLEMAAAAAILLNESDDAVLVIRGGMGAYTNDPDQLLKNKDFAWRRAQYIQKLLAGELDIPIGRIILDTNVLVPDHELTDSELSDYVVVIITMKNSQFK